MTTRLFHISDVHFGVENRAALDKVARAVAAERPALLICTGDLTQRAKPSEYAAAAEWFAALDAPVWLDPGNHDLPYFNLVERFLDPFRRYRKLCEAVAVEGFETADLVLVPLRTTVRAQTRWPWSDGVVTRVALEQARTALERYRDDPRKRIVTAHHPLHGPNPEGPSATIGGIAALGKLAAAQANAVLSGHIHTPFNEWCDAGVGRTQLIGAGTLSTRLRHGAPASYNVLTISRDSAEVEVELRVLADAAVT